MFEFLAAAFTKMTSLVASIAIAVGLVSAPPVPPEQPRAAKIVVEAKEEIKSEQTPVLTQREESKPTVTPEPVAKPKPPVQQFQAPEKTTSIVTLPNGAVVEIDVNGNIIRIIKEATQQTYSQPAVSTSALPSVSITLWSVRVTSGSANIAWTTNIPTDSKLFLIQADGPFKVIPSTSGNATIHAVDIPNLISGTSYTYTIEAIVEAQSKKIDGSFVTKQQTFTAESMKNPTNPNDTNPFLKLSSDRPFTIKKLVFIDDGTYCQSGRSFVQLTLHYLSQWRDAKKDSTGRFTFDYPYGLTLSDVTFRLSGGVGQGDGPSSSCTYEGMKFVLRDSESIIFGENGQRMEVPHVILFGQ